VLVLPVEALLLEKTSAFAFVADGGKAKKVPLKLGFNDGTKVEVVAGLTGNETVILLGKQTLADGQAVNPTEVK
jgi:membrane fusion protein (multidrug efflux system)